MKVVSSMTERLLMAENENNLGERLKACRKALLLTQQNVAEKLGVTSASISSWESGARRPDFDMLYNLGKLYNVSFDYLFGRVDSVVAYNANTMDKLEETIATKVDTSMEYAVIDFLSLDEYGRVAVMKLIENELERCKKQNALNNSESYTVVVRSVRKNN